MTTDRESELRALNPLFRLGVVVAALLERQACSLDVDAIQADYPKRFRRAGGVLECSAPVERLGRCSRRPGGRASADAPHYGARRSAGGSLRPKSRVVR